MVKLDFANAFNCANRQTMIDQVAEDFPEMVSYVQAAYGAPSTLSFGDHTISSSEGVQQGDPLGPLLFCLVIQPTLQQLQSEFKAAYLDDITIAGNPSQVVEDILHIKNQADKIGVELNLAKCELISPSQTSKETILQSFSGIQITPPEQATLLGTTLHESMLGPMINKELECLRLMQTRLRNLPSQDGMFLLRNALAMPRVMYILRTAPCFLSNALQTMT